MGKMSMYNKSTITRQYPFQYIKLCKYMGGDYHFWSRYFEEL